MDADADAYLSKNMCHEQTWYDVVVLADVSFWYLFEYILSR